MINKCVITNCASGYGTGEKKPPSPAQDQELCKKWIYFVNCKD